MNEATEATFRSASGHTGWNLSTSAGRSSALHLADFQVLIFTSYGKHLSR